MPHECSHLHAMPPPRAQCARMRAAFHLDYAALIIHHALGTKRHAHAGRPRISIAVIPARDRTGCGRFAHRVENSVHENLKPPFKFNLQQMQLRHHAEIRTAVAFLWAATRQLSTRECIETALILAMPSFLRLLVGSEPIALTFDQAKAVAVQVCLPDNSMNAKVNYAHEHTAGHWGIGPR